MRDFGQTNFGVAHRRSVIAVDRAEVTLAIDQHVTQREVLSHTHNRVVYRLVSVRVILTDYVTNDTCRFFVSTIPVVVKFMHRE